MASTCPQQQPLSISVTRSRSASSSSSSSFALQRTASADSADLAAISGSAAEKFDSLVSHIRAKNDRRQRRAFYRSVVPQRMHRQVSVEKIDLDDVVDDFAVMSRQPSRASSFNSQQSPPGSPSLKRSSFGVSSSSSASASLALPGEGSPFRRANSDTIALNSPSGMHKKRVRASLAKAARNSVNSPGKSDIRVRNSVHPGACKRTPCSMPNSSDLSTTKKSNSLVVPNKGTCSPTTGGSGNSSIGGTTGKAKREGFSWRSRGRRSRNAARNTTTESESSSSSNSPGSSSGTSSVNSSRVSKTTSCPSVSKKRSRSPTPVRDDDDESSEDSGDDEPSIYPIFPTPPASSSKPTPISPQKKSDSLYPLFPASFYPKPPQDTSKKRRSAPLSLSTSRSSLLSKEKRRSSFFFDSDSDNDDDSISRSSTGSFSSSLPVILEDSCRTDTRKSMNSLVKNDSFSASQPLEDTSSQKRKSGNTLRNSMKIPRSNSNHCSPNKRAQNDNSKRESTSETIGSPSKKRRVSQGQSSPSQWPPLPRTRSQGTHVTARALSRASSRSTATVSSPSKNGVSKRDATRKRALSNDKSQRMPSHQEKTAQKSKKPHIVRSPQKSAARKTKKATSRRTAFSLSKTTSSSPASSWMDGDDTVEESLVSCDPDEPKKHVREVDVFALPDRDLEEKIEVSAVRLTAFNRQRSVSSSSLTDEPDSIRAMRTQNLSEKSNSALLLDALLQKHSRELQKVSRIASSVSPGIRSMSRLSRRTESIKFDLEEDYKILGKISPSLECTIMYLLANGADPEYTDADGVFPLLVAVQYESSLQVVAKLLQSGANSERLFDERSMVDIAWRLDQHHVCALLVKQNAFPTAASVKPGLSTFLDYAKVHGFHQIAFQRMKSLLWEGVECHNEDWIESALRHGVPPSVRDNNEQTPLYVAVHSKAPLSLVRMMLSRGADPNIVDASRTPMMCFPLIRHGKDALGVVKLLLKYSADTGVRVGSTGQTLLDFALESAANPSYHGLLKEAAQKNQQLQRKLQERKSSRAKKKIVV